MTTMGRKAMTDEIDQLVERLRKAAHSQIYRSGVLCEEAAARIESDAKIIADLTMDRDLWRQLEEIASRQHDKRQEEARQLAAIAVAAGDLIDDLDHNEGSSAKYLSYLRQALNAYAVGSRHD